MAHLNRSAEDCRLSVGQPWVRNTCRKRRIRTTGIPPKKPGSGGVHAVDSCPEKAKAGGIKALVYVAGVMLLVGLTLGSPAAGADDLRAEFDRRYAAWKTSQKQPQRSFFASLTKELYDLIELGRPALPYLIEKLENNPDEDFRLVYPVLVLTQKLLTREEMNNVDEKYGTVGSRVRARAYVIWWKTGRLKSSERFSTYYKAWKRAKQQGDKSTADENFMDIQRLGLDVLPEVMDKIKQGDEELIPIVSRWTSYKLKKDASLKECLAWWEAHGQEYLLPPPPKE